MTDVLRSAVVFLGIDGVLNDLARVSDAPPLVAGWSSVPGASMLDPSRVARVQTICDRTGASIVIVSGWRRWASVQVIAERLAAAGLRAPVLGAVAGVRFRSDARCGATRAWLAAHPEVTRWCVIDHAWALWGVPLAPWLRGRLVVPEDGITDDDAEQAIAAINMTGAGP